MDNLRVNGICDTCNKEKTEMKEYVEVIEDKQTLKFICGECENKKSQERKITPSIMKELDEYLKLNKQ